MPQTAYKPAPSTDGGAVAGVELVHVPPAGVNELVAQLFALPNDQDTCP